MTQRDWQKDMETCEAATPGPWKYHEPFSIRSAEFENERICGYAEPENASFIVQAREALPYWLQEAKERGEQEQRLKEAWEQLRGIVSTNATGGKGEDINDYDIMLNMMDDLLYLDSLYPDTPAPTPEIKQPAARPLDEWHEEMGDMLWWMFPIQEPPYCGNPLDSDWSDCYTHWTPFVIPADPAPKEGTPDDEPI